MTTVDQIPGYKKFSTITLILSTALFILSFILPCFRTQEGSGETGQGVGLLISGFFGFGICPAWYSWLANPFLVISWMSFDKNLLKSTVLSFLAVVSCLSFLFVDRIIVDEAGNYNHIIGRQVGYWLWASAALVLFSGNMIRYIIKKRTTP